MGERATARVSSEQVLSFRLANHGLDRRAPLSGHARVLRGMGGAQAQVLAAAEASLAARVSGLSPERFERWLWKDRSLARAWCMRQTLHLVPSRDLGIFVRGTTSRAEREIRWTLNRGVDPSALEALLAATLGALHEPCTGTELIERVRRETNLPLDTWEGGGWGNRRKIPSVRLGKQLFPADFLLHLVGARGVVCAGPPRDGNSTYVRAEKWVRGWREVSRERAEEQLLRIYLHAYGPATPQDFVAWSRGLLRDAHKVWDRISPEVSKIESEEQEGWVLRDDVGPLVSCAAPREQVRLLPSFDSFLLGHHGRGHLLPPEHVGRVYRPQGWLTPVVLLNGRVGGTWAQETRAGILRISLRPFAPLPKWAVSGIREECQEIACFQGRSGPTVLGLN